MPILRSYRRSGLQFFYFLTINPKNYENLSQGLKHARKSFSKWLRLSYIKKRIKGGIYCIESPNKGNGWNVHIHCIIFGQYIDNKVKEKNKDSRIVSLFKSSSGRDVNIRVNALHSPYHACNYLLKYLSSEKDSFDTIENMAEYMVIMQKQRLITTFGEFYNFKKHKYFLLETKSVCRICGSEFIYKELEIEIKQILKELKPPLPQWF